MDVWQDVVSQVINVFEKRLFFHIMHIHQSSGFIQEDNSIHLTGFSYTGHVSYISFTNQIPISIEKIAQSLNNLEWIVVLLQKLSDDMKPYSTIMKKIISK